MSINIDNIKNNLNNRSVSYSNIIFWLENPELINRLINIENSIIKKEWREATKTTNAGWVFISYSVDKIYSTEEMLEHNMGIKNIPYFKKYFDRYVRAWYSFFMEGYREEGKEIEEENAKIFDWYPIDINMFIWISGLSNKEYNIDLMIQDCIKEKEIILENYRIKKEGVDIEIMNEIVSLFPGKVDEYKKGKTNLLNMFLGEYLKRLKDKNVDKAMLLTDIKNFIEQC